MRFCATSGIPSATLPASGRAEAVRIARKPDIVGKSRVTMSSGKNVRYASRTVAVDSFTHRKRNHVLGADILDPRHHRNCEAWPPKPEAIPNQILGGNSLHARTDAPGKASNSAHRP